MYSRAQKASPNTLATALQQLLVRTGYVGVLALAAPNPSQGGDVDVLW